MMDQKEGRRSLPAWRALVGWHAFAALPEVAQFGKSSLGRESMAHGAAWRAPFLDGY
jgi:hypothetical protein